MDRLIKTGLLLDFYGQLLTKRQQDIFDLHYNGDYSLGEIAEELNISRQGVYDSLKRGRATLEELESKLGLVSKFIDQKVKLRGVLSALSGIDAGRLNDDDRLSLKRAAESLEAVIDEIG